MELIYNRKYHIDTVYLDCFGRVKPSVLLYFAQEIAGEHCLELGTDWDTLQKKGLFWAVIRTSVRVRRLPVAGEDITLETWPMPATRVAYPRCTVGYGENGEELFSCMSLWVLMDTDSRAMVLPGKSGVEVPGILRGTEPPSPRSLTPKDMGNYAVRQVGYSLLDRNGHMNNTKYLEWVDDLLPAQFHKEHPVKEIHICYLTEAREGQVLKLWYEMDPEGCLLVDAHREKTDVRSEKERVFAAKLVY